MDRGVPFKFLVSYEDALKIILDNVKPVKEKEKVSIEELAGRVLAEDVEADTFIPPFNRAAMDGYAVKAEDTYGATPTKPKTLRLTGVLTTSGQVDRVVGKGECIEITTGSPMPAGADAVVMLEFTERIGEEVHVFKPVYPGANVSFMGEDIRKGEVVLRDGEFLTPAKVGVLASLGRREVYVYRKPKVAIVPTGVEVKEPGSKLKEGEIYDINSYTLISLLSQNGATPKRFPPTPDVFDELSRIVKSLTEEYDTLVFSGGSSVGKYDLLARVVEECGKILFHGVQIKPGKPTLFGLVNGKPVFGMPGYPTSCLSNAYLMLIPAVRK
ncbi:MAG: molybdopterin molybdotransferase MoeA, partial [Candidatus Bathyarchaeota archaeon]|nr:molybdopterin molybdotransferase MoeA [Candidatus Bathyarchaeota archaeon]